MGLRTAGRAWFTLGLLAGLNCATVADRQAQAQDWPTYHGGYGLDGRAEAAPPDEPVRRWRFKAEGPIEATPVSGERRIYFVTTKGVVTALDLSGRQVWKAQIANDTVSAPLIFAGSSVVAATDGGVLYGFEAGTGKEKWAYKVDKAIRGSPNRVDLPKGSKGVVAIAQADGALHCVDLETGRAVWETGALERCDGSAGFGNGWIVMGSCASALHVFSVEKGAKEADIELGGDCQVAGGVAVSGKTAFVGTRSGKVCAVDIAAKKVAWSNQDCTQEVFTTPAVDDRFVVFGCNDGKIYALKRETGAKAWDFETAGDPTSPVIAGNRVVATSGGTLYILELETGKKVWTARVSDRITSPAVAESLVIVGAEDGTVSAYGRPGNLDGR
ncbi:MAG TPA: PQQ-binding-like beta-propeller repeat protein [Planctomycetota bacterium]|nr:PQQ-binding-like beta-propeller repeat protein [Planctomycetota bacterium]